MTDQPPQIYGLMAQILKDMEPIAKDRESSGYGDSYKFRGIDAAMKALHPLLAKYGVFVTPTVEERIPEERTSRSNSSLWVMHLKVRYDFWAPDGSHVSATTWGEAMDSSDKATNKALAAAMKYVIFQTFCIPTDDQARDDADGSTEPATGGRPTSNSLASDKQIGFCRQMFDAAHIDQDKRPAYIKEVIGREVTSLKELKKGECSKVIDQLKLDAEKAKGEEVPEEYDGSPY